MGVWNRLQHYAGTILLLSSFPNAHFNRCVVQRVDDDVNGERFLDHFDSRACVLGEGERAVAAVIDEGEGD